MSRGLILLLLAMYGGVAANAELGRLFFTPAQRAMLDNARKQNVRTEIGNDNPDQSNPLPQNIIVNGLVRRSDGKTTVWINNQPITESQLNGVNVTTRKSDNRVRLTVPDSGHSVDLKVGQTLDLNSGSIQEGSVGNVSPQANPEKALTTTPPATSSDASTKVSASPPARKSGNDTESGSNGDPEPR